MPDELTNWQMGKGAGFYLDATETPWAEHYQMYTYITEELPDLVSQHFRVDMGRQGIFGHSMGGHGAMTIALKNPERFRSCSAFAPIVAPSSADWSVGAFEKYLGSDKAAWRKYDACALVEDGARFPECLIDQGKADGFLENGLRPWLFEEAVKERRSASRSGCTSATTTPIISSRPSWTTISSGTPKGWVDTRRFSPAASPSFGKRAGSATIFRRAAFAGLALAPAMV